MSASITSWAVYVPSVDPQAPPSDRARDVLGRKGLLFKEPATRLALCAIHRALGLADGDPAVPPAVDPEIAVVGSANLGNVATVAAVARAVREGGRRDVSPLAAPNASSNVLAATAAIWFGFGGPNLMVCGGATSGLDAVHLGERLLRAGRARVVVVVGAEPDDEVASALRGRPLLAGAACVILRAAGSPSARVHLDFVTTPATPTTDAYSAHGDGYGATGVRLIASACDAGVPATVVCGDSVDGYRAVTLCPR